MQHINNKFDCKFTIIDNSYEVDARKISADLSSATLHRVNGPNTCICPA